MHFSLDGWTALKTDDCSNVAHSEWECLKYDALLRTLLGFDVILKFSLLKCWYVESQ